MPLIGAQDVGDGDEGREGEGEEGGDGVDGEEEVGQTANMTKIRTHEMRIGGKRRY